MWILLELLVPPLLRTGLGTRLVGLGFAGPMLGAITSAYAPHDSFMDWTGGQMAKGFEQHRLRIGAARVLVFAGGGRWSVDSRIHLLPA